MTIKLSVLADQDIDKIFDYSVREFGITKAREHIAHFQQSFQRLSDNPKIGISACGMHRVLCENHVIFYQTRETDILIVRVLDQRMQPENYLN